MAAVETELTRRCRSRIEGTIYWAFGVQEFKEWRLRTSENRSSRSLWLNGLPGVGKSTRQNFLWVRLVLDSLKRKTSNRQVQNVIDNLPNNLEGIYEQVLQLGSR